MHVSSPLPPINDAFYPEANYLQHLAEERKPLESILNALLKGRSISVKNGELAIDRKITSLWEKIYFPRAVEKRGEVASYLISQLRCKALRPAQEQLLRIIARAFIDQATPSFFKNSPMKELDYEIGRLDWKNLGDEKPFKNPQLAQQWHKWQKYGLNSEAFMHDYAFTQFAFKSNLASQMKIFPNEDFTMIDGAPHVRVESQPMHYRDFVEKFHITTDSYAGEKRITEIASGQVYTYLGKGDGLVAHDPYQQPLFAQISQISKAENQKLLQTARLFERAGEMGKEREINNQKRHYTIQIVSSYFSGHWAVKAIASNFVKTLLEPQHAYLRYIDPEGRVFEEGLLMENMKASGDFFKNRPCRFSSPDPFSYVSPSERIVTNIAASEEEISLLRDYFSHYQQTDLASHALTQNCTSFIRKAIGYSTGIEVQSKITMKQLLWRLLPSGFQTIIAYIQKAVWALTSFIVNLLPKQIAYVIKRLIKLNIALHNIRFAAALNLFQALLGGCFGPQSPVFAEAKEDEETQLKPPARDFKRWYELKRHIADLPDALQQWQRAQPSTVIYKNPIKLSVAPPMD
jgi:hypothetical protein